MDAQNTLNVNPQLVKSSPATEDQKELLVEFMERYGDRIYSYPKEVRCKIEVMWYDLVHELNSRNEDPNKPIRTDQQWKKIWRDMKSSIGLKSLSNKPLTPLETRVYAVMKASGPTEFNVQSKTTEDVVVERDPFPIGTHSVFDHVQVEDEVLPSEQTPPIVSKQTSPRAKQMPSRDKEISPRPEEISPRPEEIPQPDVMPSTFQEPQAASSTETRPNNTDSKRVSPNNATGVLIPAMWTSADFESYNFPEARLSFERLREQNHHQREMRRLDLDSRRLGIDQQLIHALNRLADTNEKNIQKSG